MLNALGFLSSPWNLTASRAASFKQEQTNFVCPSVTINIPSAEEKKENLTSCPEPVVIPVRVESQTLKKAEQEVLRSKGECEDYKRVCREYGIDHPTDKEILSNALKSAEKENKEEAQLLVEIEELSKEIKRKLTAEEEKKAFFELAAVIGHWY